MANTHAINTVDLKPLSIPQLQYPGNYAYNYNYSPRYEREQSLPMQIQPMQHQPVQMSTINNGDKYVPRSPEKKQSGNTSPRKTVQHYTSTRGNPFTEVRRNIINDLNTSELRTSPRSDADNPADVRVRPNTADKTTNWHIVIGIVNAKQGPYVALGAFSFSNEKMPKKGREKVVTLANGDKCTIMNVEIKFKMRTASGFVDTIRRSIFKGSQRPVKKGQWITNIVPNPAELSRVDDSDSSLESIRDFPLMVKFVYIKLIQDIQRLYRTTVELGEVVFEQPETSQRSSIRVSPIQSPTCSPAWSPLSSPTKSPVSAPSFADAVKGEPKSDTPRIEPARKPAQPDLVMITKDATKPAAPANTPLTDRPKIYNDVAHLYFINASSLELIDLGLAKDICPRK